MGLSENSTPPNWYLISIFCHFSNIFPINWSELSELQIIPHFQQKQIYIYIHIMIHHQSKLEPQHRFNTLRRWPTFMAWHGDPTVHGHLNRINGDELILTVGFWGALLSNNPYHSNRIPYSKNARVSWRFPSCASHFYMRYTLVDLTPPNLHFNIVYLYNKCVMINAS